MFIKYLIGFVMLVGLQLTNGVKAQILYPESPHFSTFDWTQTLRLQILDKSHAFGDILYDRGFSRIFTPLTKHEYELDMMNQEFYFGDQFIWDRGNKNGLRSRFSSYDKSRWAVFTELNVDSELNDHSKIGLNTYLQQNARANRALFEFSYKRKINKDHSLSIQQTVAEYKKDVDVTLSYRYKSKKSGLIRFDVTYQDYLNNIVNDVGNDPYFQSREEASTNLQEDVLSPNVLFLGRWLGSGENQLHWDLSFILQPPVKKEIFGESGDLFTVRTKEYLYVINGLLDVKKGPFTLGVFGYITYNNEDRVGFTDSTLVDYNSNQMNSKLGVIAKASFGNFSPLFRLSREYYTDKQNGNTGGVSVVNQEFDFYEKRWMLDTGLTYNINNSVSVTTRYQSQLRTTDENVIRQLYNTGEIENMVRNWSQFYINDGQRLDNRVSLHVSLFLHQKISFQIFGAFDLDADTNRYNERIQRFDKGGLKMVVTLD